MTDTLDIPGRHAENLDFPNWEVCMLSTDDALMNRVARLSALYEKLDLEPTHRAEA